MNAKSKTSKSTLCVGVSDLIWKLTTLICFQEVLSTLEPHLVAVPGSLSLSDKVLQLSMRDNTNAKFYAGSHNKPYDSDLKPGLKPDVTSSSASSTTDFQIQPLAPR